LKSKKLFLLLLILLLIIFIYVKYKEIDHNEPKNIIKFVNNKIDYKKIINNLRNEYNNQDIIGILKIPNTKLNVPILQTNNNEYYLNHNIYHNESYKGSIFLDYRVNINNSKKLLIYGHSYDKEYFEFNILENYYAEEYYKNNKYIQIITDNMKKIYEIFSVYVEAKDFSYMNIDFIDNNDFYNHIKELKRKSIYNIDVNLNENDEVLILQTCSNNVKYKNYLKKYLLIISRRIK